MTQKTPRFGTFRFGTNPLTIKVVDTVTASEVTSQVVASYYTPTPAVTDYYKIRESQHTNALAEIGTRLKDSGLNLNNTAKISYRNYDLFIENYPDFAGGISTTALKLLDALIITATEQGKSDTDTLIELPLNKYMTMRGLRDAKEARNQVERDLKALEAITLEYRGKGKQKENYLRLKIGAGKSGIVRGVVIFDFREEFFSKALEQRQFMYLHKETLKLNDKYNPHSYYFSRKATLHRRQNGGKPNENIIGVRTLVNSSPELRHKVKDKTARFSQQILNPFERDMDALNNIFTWEYTGENGQKAEIPDTLHDFLALNVKIDWLHYPDTPDIKKLDKAHKAKVNKRSRRKPSEMGGNRVGLGG